LAERKILYEIGQDEFALKALLVAEQEIRYQSKPKEKKYLLLQKILDEIDILKTTRWVSPVLAIGSHKH
jgi:hypothetical protein